MRREKKRSARCGLWWVLWICGDAATLALAVNSYGLCVRKGVIVGQPEILCVLALTCAPCLDRLWMTKGAEQCVSVCVSVCLCVSVCACGCFFEAQHKGFDNQEEEEEMGKETSATRVFFFLV